MTMTDRNVESRLDLEHELPAGDESQENGATPGTGTESETGKLKAERDTLFDRLAGGIRQLPQAANEREPGFS